MDPNNPWQGSLPDRDQAVFAESDNDEDHDDYRVMTALRVIWKRLNSIEETLTRLVDDRASRR